MRRSIPLASFWSATIASMLCGAAPAWAATETMSGFADSSEAGGGWLPTPEENLENPDRLEEEPDGDRQGVLVRGSVTRGRYRTRRISLTGARLGIAGEAAALIDGGHFRPGARIAASRGRATLAAGRVSISRAPPLLAGAMRLVRAGGRVETPRWGGIDASPSLGSSAGTIDGAAASWRGGRASLWSFAGIRGRPREALGGLGAGIACGSTRVAAAFGAVTDAASPTGARASERNASVTAVCHGRDGGTAIEALSGTAGRALLVGATAQREAVVLAARWRYRSWNPRRVAAEISAESRGSGPRARLTWRSWSASAAAVASAAGDDGTLELEGSEAPDGTGRIRLRLGSAGYGGARASDGPHEAYAFLDAVLARDGGRILSAHVLRRLAASASSRASSTTVGARLDLGKGAHSLLVESTRIVRDAPAWGIAISPSGDATLRSRARPGLLLSARGAFGMGPGRLGYALERGEDAGGSGPWSGTVWIRLDHR